MATLLCLRWWGMPCGRRSAGLWNSCCGLLRSHARIQRKWCCSRPTGSRVSHTSLPSLVLCSKLTRLLLPPLLRWLQVLGQQRERHALVLAEQLFHWMRLKGKANQHRCAAERG